MLLTLLSPALLGVVSAAVQLPFSPEPEKTLGYIYPTASVIMMVQCLLLFYRESKRSIKCLKWTKIVSFLILPAIVIIFMIIEIADSTKEMNRPQQAFTITIQIMLPLIYAYQHKDTLFKRCLHNQGAPNVNKDSAVEMVT